MAAILAALAACDVEPRRPRRLSAWALAGRLRKLPIDVLRAYAAGRIDRV